MEYTSSELASMRYTVPSRSQVEDWCESVERMYHATVASVQLDCHRKILSMTENRDEWIRDVRRSNGLTRRQAEQAVDEAIAQHEANLRSQSDAHIRSLMDWRDWQKRAGVAFLGRGM